MVPEEMEWGNALFWKNLALCVSAFRIDAVQLNSALFGGEINAKNELCRA